VTVMKAFPRDAHFERVLAGIRERWLAAGCPYRPTEDGFIAYALRGVEDEAERDRMANRTRNYLWATRLGDAPSPN